jgi:hypothetical protein
MIQESPRPELLTVCRWEVPHSREQWWPIASDYVQLLWLPILGPSSIVLLQRLDLLIGRTARISISAEELARSLGLGHTPSRGSLLDRSIDRCRDFHLLRELIPGLIEIPRELPPLSNRQLKRLPESLQAIASNRPELNRYRTITDRDGRLHQLTATLVNLGAADDEICDQLVRLGYAPSSVDQLRS